VRHRTNGTSKGAGGSTRQKAKLERLPAAIYVRISEDREGRELGVQRQEEDCRDLALRQGLEVLRVYKENDVGASTRSRKPRPEYEAMLQAADRREFGVILAYSNSRLTRRPMELEGLIQLHERTGVRLMTKVSGNDDLSTADGRMVARIKASVDAAEAERTGERVQRAARQRAEQGRWHGGTNPPFGYRLVKLDRGGHTLKQDFENAALLKEAAGRILNGESLYGICNDWNGRGLTTSRGAHWRPKTIRNALLNGSAIGKRQVEDPETGELHLYDTEWEPILDRVTWDRLHDVLTDPVRTWQPNSGSYASKLALGGGLTLCGLCGKKLVTQRHRGQSRLICHKQATGGCGVITINYEHLEEFVLGLVWEVLDTPDVQAGLGHRGEGTEDVALREELAEIERLQDKNYDAFMEDIVDKERYLRRKGELDARRESVEVRLVDLTSGLLLDAVPSLDAARERWERGDVPWRRAFLSALIREVRVGRHPEGVASTITRFTKRGETDEAFEERKHEHRHAIMRQRLTIDWRA
jgi:DNA invertase Pin-like site-specific DNA recombinase